MLCAWRPRFFPVQTSAFYSKYWSIYTNITMFPSKWSFFYNPLRSSLMGSYPWTSSCLSVGRGWCKFRGRGGFKWVILRSCTRFNFGAKYLLRQTQPRSQCPIWLPNPQGTWGSRSTEYLGIWPSDRNCNWAINPARVVRNRLWVGLTQSGKYD